MSNCVTLNLYNPLKNELFGKVKETNFLSVLEFFKWLKFCNFFHLARHRAESYFLKKNNNSILANTFFYGDCAANVDFLSQGLAKSV